MTQETTIELQRCPNCDRIQPDEEQRTEPILYPDVCQILAVERWIAQNTFHDGRWFALRANAQDDCNDHKVDWRNRAVNQSNLIRQLYDELGSLKSENQSTKTLLESQTNHIQEFEIYLKHVLLPPISEYAERIHLPWLRLQDGINVILAGRTPTSVAVYRRGELDGRHNHPPSEGNPTYMAGYNAGRAGATSNG